MVVYEEVRGSVVFKIATHNKNVALYLFFFFFFHPVYSRRPSFSLPLLYSRNSDPGGHIAGSSPPLLTTVRALHFFREKIPALCSVVDSRRSALTALGALSS